MEPDNNVVPFPSERPSSLIGVSPAIIDLRNVIRQVAPSFATVLITGESGTGKELVAEEIHRFSGRQGKLVVFDCSARHPDIYIADLFGHEKGAFTGADRCRKGIVASAEGSSILIDEVGRSPVELQAKLLRLSYKHEYQPMGSDVMRFANVRIIVATSADLEQSVREGKFLPDLLNRLNVIRIHLPPLRGRLEDILLLWERFAAEMRLSIPLSRDAKMALLDHAWPDNVRGLENAVIRAKTYTSGEEIRVKDLGIKLDASFNPGFSQDSKGGTPRFPSFEDLGGLSWENYAYQTIRHLTKECSALGWSREEISRRIGISRTGLWRRERSKDSKSQ